MFEADNLICIPHGKDITFLRKQYRENNDPLIYLTALCWMGKRIIHQLCSYHLHIRRYYRKAANRTTRSENKWCNYCIFGKLKISFFPETKNNSYVKTSAENQTLETVPVSDDVWFKVLLFHGIHKNQSMLHSLKFLHNTLLLEGSSCHFSFPYSCLSRNFDDLIIY